MISLDILDASYTALILFGMVVPLVMILSSKRLQRLFKRDRKPRRIRCEDQL